MEIMILYDNKTQREELIADWGFSLYIGSPLNILFDFGRDPKILRHNIERLSIDLSEVKTLFISHYHNDHIGGLTGIIDRLPRGENRVVYGPPSPPGNLKKEVSSHNWLFSETIGFSQIGEDVYTTGPLYPGNEQSLILRKDGRLVVITGCAHPGVEKILSTVQEYLKEEIYLLIGGFHTHNWDVGRLRGLIGFLSDRVKYVLPCHCSGEVIVDLLKDTRMYMGDCGCGKTVEV